MLAQFNNFQISVADRMRFLRAYFQREGLQGGSKKTLAQEIASASLTHWKRLWKKRKERCLRTGKGLETFKTGSWKGMIRKDYNLKKFLFLIR